MKYQLLKYLFVFLLLLLLGSCQPVFLALYGMKKPEQQSLEKIAKAEKKYCINPEDVYNIDISFFSFLDSLNNSTMDTSISHIIKDHSQPLQVMVFDNGGKFCSFHINCYAEAFPNLKWDGFDIFPPITAAPIDTIITFDLLKNTIPYLQKLTEENPEKYTVIIFWTGFLGRQSKRLISLMQEKIPRDQANLVYVNIDAGFFSFVR